MAQFTRKDLRIGDRVVAAGWEGTIQAINNDNVVLDLDPGQCGHVDRLKGNFLISSIMSLSGSRAREDEGKCSASSPCKACQEAVEQDKQRMTLDMYKLLLETEVVDRWEVARKILMLPAPWGAGLTHEEAKKWLVPKEAPWVPHLTIGGIKAPKVGKHKKAKTKNLY